MLLLILWIQGLNVAVNGQKSANAVTLSYHCGRYNCDCANDQLCPGDTYRDSGGRCVCEPPWTGYDCGMHIERPCSVNPCSNGGQCWMGQSGHQQCHCPPAFFGPNCELPRVNMTCYNDHMELSVKPFCNPFSGTISTTNHFDKCKDEDNWDFMTLDDSYIAINLDYDDCGGAKVPKTASSHNPNDPKTISHTFELHIAYHPDFTTAFDQVFSFTCNLTENGEVFSANVLEKECQDCSRVLSQGRPYGTFESILRIYEALTIPHRSYQTIVCVFMLCLIVLVLSKVTSDTKRSQTKYI